MWNRTRVRLWLLGILIVALASCAARKPIPVGFAGELTGRNAELGVQGRNGAQLAVEELNEQGGIGGRPIELLVRDDVGTPEGAQAADSDLIESGVVAIIGHMTSAQTVAAVPVTEQAGMVLLSPTTSTSQLSGLDDHFFRVTSDSSVAGAVMAGYALKQRGIYSIAALYDSDNAAFSETYWGAFYDTFVTAGGQVTAEISYSSSAEPDFGPLVAQARESGAEGLFMVSSGLDAALIAQQVQNSGWQAPLFASGWSQTETLIRHGGQAVDGLEMVRIYNPDSPAPAFRLFKTRYQERFGHDPAFAAAQSYEAVKVLAAALERTGGEAEGLGQALVEIGTYKGLGDTLVMDAFGDVVRTHYLVRVQDGAFVVVGPVQP